MKVLHLTTHLNSGGITRYILSLARPLKARGVEMAVVSSGGELEGLFHKKDVPAYNLNIRTKSELHPKLYFAIPRVLQIIHEQKIDLLHAHTRVTQILALWVQKFSRIPVVTTCHGFYKNRLGRRLIPAWGDLSVAISHPVEEQLKQQFHMTAERVRMIHNGIDIEELRAACGRYNGIRAKADYGFDPQDPVMGVVARLVEDKGHQYLIEAMDELKNEFPAIRLLIVGDGPCRPRLERMVHELKLKKRVVFTGNLADISKPLTALDIFVFPATWREGFGLSIAEAMICGKPVIVTNIWALNSLIQNGVTGLLVEPKNAKQLTIAIQTLLKDPVYAKKLGEEGCRMAHKLFSIERMADEIYALYGEALRLRGRSEHRDSLTVEKF